MPGLACSASTHRSAIAAAILAVAAAAALFTVAARFLAVATAFFAIARFLAVAAFLAIAHAFLAIAFLTIATALFAIVLVSHDFTPLCDSGSCVAGVWNVRNRGSAKRERSNARAELVSSAHSSIPCAQIDCARASRCRRHAVFS
jgi:hypothetical protein